MLNILIFPDKPSSPRNLQVKAVSENEMTVKWVEPESDGGADITSYVIEIRETRRTAWHRVGTPDSRTKEFTIKPLISGENYVVQIAAENEVGLGEFTELSQAVTAKSQLSKCHYDTKLL